MEKRLLTLFFICFAAVSAFANESKKDAADTVYVQRIATPGYEDRQVQTWEAIDYAQRNTQHRISWGFKGGVNTMGVTRKSQVAFNTQFKSLGDAGIYNVNNKNMGVGWQAGAFGRVNLDKYNIQLEALYHESRSVSSVMTNSAIADDSRIESNVIFRTLDVPLEFGVKISLFRIFLGPQLSIPLGNKCTIDNELAKEYMENIGLYVIDNVDFKNPKVFFHYGVAFEFWHVTLDIRNVVPFTKSTQVFHIMDRVYEEKMRLSSWQFMLGFKF